MSEIIPAILAKSSADLDLKLSEIPEEIDFIHIDVLEEDVWTKNHVGKSFEAHLMVSDPGGIADIWIERGAGTIIVHKLSEKILGLRGRVKIGLAVELQTPLESVWPLVPKIDFLHLMSIAEIGRQGNPLDEKIFDRIKAVRERFPDLVISTDGGVNKENMARLKETGANRFVVGSGFKDLWKSLMKN